MTSTIKLKCPRCGGSACLERMNTRRPCYTISCDSPFCNIRVTMAVNYAANYSNIMILNANQDRAARAETIAAWNGLKRDPAYTGKQNSVYRYSTSFTIH